MPLTIRVESIELYNPSDRTFTQTKACDLVLEHSLVSISKWESKWHKMYLETENKTTEELLSYIQCMTINKNVPDYTYYALSQKNIDDIVRYMKDPMTASIVNDEGTGGQKERFRQSSSILDDCLWSSR